jgi:hypothetical protein
MLIRLARLLPAPRWLPRPLDLVTAEVLAQPVWRPTMVVQSQLADTVVLSSWHARQFNGTGICLVKP